MIGFSVAWSDDEGSRRLGLPANREGAHTSVFSSSRVGLVDRWRGLVGGIYFLVEVGDDGIGPGTIMSCSNDVSRCY